MGGTASSRWSYLKWPGIEDSSVVHGQIASGPVPVNPKTVGDIVRRSRGRRRATAVARGKSLALLVWPGKQPSGKLIVNKTYLPETVDSVDGLKEQRRALRLQARNSIPV